MLLAGVPTRCQSRYQACPQRRFVAGVANNSGNTFGTKPLIGWLTRWAQACCWHGYPVRHAGAVSGLKQCFDARLFNAVAGRLAVNWVTGLRSGFGFDPSTELVFGSGAWCWLRWLVAAWQAMRGQNWWQCCARILLPGLPRICHSGGRREAADDRVDGGMRGHQENC